MAVTSNCVNEKKFFQLEPGEETRNIPILIDTYQCIAWWRLWKQSKKIFTVFWVLYTQLYTIQLGNLTNSCITFIIMMMISGWSWSMWWWWHELKQLLSVPLCQLLLSSKCTCSSCSWSLILVSVVSLISVLQIGSFLSLSKMLAFDPSVNCLIMQDQPESEWTQKVTHFVFHFGNPLSPNSTHLRLFEVELHMIRKWKVSPWSIWHISM